MLAALLKFPKQSCGMQSCGMQVLQLFRVIGVSGMHQSKCFQNTCESEAAAVLVRYARSKVQHNVLDQD